MPTKVIQTGIARAYVKNWTAEMAVREVIQNWLDSKSEFKCEGELKYENGFLVAKDFGPGLEMRHLALGISEKSDTARGQFGEGLKLALLVLAREGRSVSISSKGNRIVPVLEQSVDFGTEVMAFHVSPCGDTVGTLVTVEALEDEVAAAKEYFSEFVPGLRNLEGTSLSLPRGAVYANETRVAELDTSLFSYHINGRDAQSLCNRDRTTVNMWDLQSAASRLLVEHTNREVMRLTLESFMQDDQVWEHDVHPQTWNLKGEILEAWTAEAKRLGKVCLAADSVRMNSMAEYMGFTVLVVPQCWKVFLARVGIVLAGDVAKSEMKKEMALRIEELTSEERGNLGAAAGFIRKHYADPGEVLVVEYIDCVGSDEHTVGAWDPKLGCILIKRSVLSESLQRVLYVLLHETVHKVSYMGDCTPEFEAAWNKLCADLICKLVHIPAS